MDAFFMDISRIHQSGMLMGATAEMQRECVIYWKNKTKNHAANTKTGLGLHPLG